MDTHYIQRCTNTVNLRSMLSTAVVTSRTGCCDLENGPFVVCRPWAKHLTNMHSVQSRLRAARSSFSVICSCVLHTTVLDIQFVNTTMSTIVSGRYIALQARELIGTFKLVTSSVTLSVQSEVTTNITRVHPILEPSQQMIDQHSIDQHQP